MLAFAGCIGLTFLVLGCALRFEGRGPLWWPLFVLIFYFFAPLPLTIARRYSEDMGGGSNACLEFAQFLTTGIVVSAFALPILLSSVEVVTSFFSN